MLCNLGTNMRKTNILPKGFEQYEAMFPNSFSDSRYSCHIHTLYEFPDYKNIIDPGHRNLLDKENTLIVCLTEYWGDGSKSYLLALGKGIPADCLILYIGPNICSYELTVENELHFSALTGKKPLYWDNYPVNDANMADEFRADPITGGSSDLYKYSEGHIANPMEYMESYIISLCTRGEYLYDSKNYDPDVSHRKT